MNVGGARKALASHPVSPRRHWSAPAEQVGRDSLDGIRRVVGSLRSGRRGPGRPTDSRRHWGLWDPSKVRGARQVGADIELLSSASSRPSSRCSRPRRWPGSRREALTNCRAARPGRPVRVAVVVGPTASAWSMVLQRRRPPATPRRSNRRQGLGLVGTRERVLSAGEVAAGPHRGRLALSAGAIPSAPRRDFDLVDEPP